ncbi:MAG: zinc ribbon domain-containing protein [Methanobrevibacter sp.]|nr:zinc ribbon domain-containing protein [Methanobrevibacter sp.]MBQ6627595.1 zinc ribbon domain-containing protein [Methanobrevibacter sp.]
MKKCPECGNPSYDGAPVCGNCGYKFPKPKVAAKRESIFEGQPRVEKKIEKEKPEVKKPSNEPSVLDIIKEKKLIIGIILLITLIVICGIFITGSNKNATTSVISGDLADYDAGDFSFKYPKDWEQVNLTDSDHETAIFFKDNNTVIEHYNISSSATSLKEINQQRISRALSDGDAVELLETVTLDGRNGSNIILEDSDGNYTRYVSMFTDGELYVFKITGDSINSITSDKINAMVNSANIA